MSLEKIPRASNISKKMKAMLKWLRIRVCTKAAFEADSNKVEKV